MPHPLVSMATIAGGSVRGAIPLRWSPPVRSTARWPAERARRWQSERGWLVGANFVPSTAGNQLEMWQADTWDPDTIDRELGWAADLGMNSMRVFLHDLLWNGDAEHPGDPDAFVARIDRFLEIADGHGIATLLVLFDGVWDPHPRLGAQREPRPGVHNSTWVQGPGADVLADPSRWPALRPYVEGVIARFGDDARVVGWDLFNEPDNPNALSWARREVGGKSRRVTALVHEVFDWAQAVDPAQPLTAGVYVGTGGAVERVGALNRALLSRSDVISFHSYARRGRLLATIDHLSHYERPLWCTEWMARPMSPVALIEDLATHDVCAWNWGLVDGRSQTKYSWTSWVRPDKPTRPWFHDLLHPDGTPYDAAEAATFSRAARRWSGRSASR